MRPSGVISQHFKWLLLGGAERRKALVRNAAPRGSTLRSGRPSSGRELPAHNADRRASRRSTAAFFLRPRDRLLETDRGGHTERP